MQENEEVIEVVDEKEELQKLVNIVLIKLAMHGKCEVDETIQSLLKNIIGDAV